MLFIDSSFAPSLPLCGRQRDDPFDDSYYGSFFVYFVSFFERKQSFRLTCIKVPTNLRNPLLRLG
jgi:hypothetical protein